MRAWALAGLGLSVAAAALTGCSDGDAPVFADVLSPEGGPSEPESATTAVRQQLGTVSTMPAALRIAAITAAQEDASARYDFEQGPDRAADRLVGHNHAQRLGIDVDVQGAHLTDMGAGNAGVGWRLGLRLGQVCRASSCTRMVAMDAELDASRNRAVIRHVGGVDEWYVNGPLGVEQGFTIANRPAMEGEADRAPLVLEVDLSGDLDAEMQPGGAWVSLVDESGRAVARYSDLYARDAGGMRLDASMVASNGRISLVVSDEGASYPIEIDPLVWVETGILDAGSPEDAAFFGSAVALDGDIAIVGAPYEDGTGTDQGAAYVFERDYPQAGDWGQRKRLQPAGIGDGDRFGSSVGLSADRAIVGAPSKNMVGLGSGIAYVFERNHNNTPDSWDEAAQLLPLDHQQGDNFGWSVAIAGDTAVVGARAEDGAGTNRGSAYVFDRNHPTANAWDQRAKLVAGDPNDNDLFGTAVAIVHDAQANDDRVIVGASGDDEAATNAGAAYVFGRNSPSANAWGQQRKLIPVGTTIEANFGSAVAMSGDLALVGSPGESNDTGAAYVFERNLSGTDQWGQRNKLLASPAELDSSFGEAVAISEENALVGAGNSSQYAGGAGMVFFFLRNEPAADAWGVQNGQGASDAENEAHYGGAVSLSGTSALVGAAGFDGALGTNRGRAYLLQPRLTTGEACEEALECISGFCADGVCCDAACDGGADDCQACSVEAGGVADGSCGPRVDGSACTDGVYCNGTETCTDGSCGSPTGDPCDGPDDDDDCVESCDETASSCTANDPDGSSCADGLRTCQTGTCIGDAGTECTDGTECETSYCTDGVCCTESDCSPYRCGAAGDCGSTCTMSAECATGFHCDGTGRCVADGAPGGAGTTEDEGGCSCRLGTERHQRDGLVPLLGLVAVLGLRRRRRA